MAFKAFLNGEEGGSVALLGSGSPGPREQVHYALFEVRVGRNVGFIFTQSCEETHQRIVCDVLGGPVYDGCSEEGRKMHHGERFNTATHTVGAVLAAISGVFLLIFVARTGDPWKIVSCSIYAVTLLALYVTSSLYHAMDGTPKDVLRKLDHCAIYLLIAGSYTPFTLVTLRGPWGWSMFGVVWALAALSSCRSRSRFDKMMR
jgi:hypothetical protein